MVRNSSSNRPAAATGSGFSAGVLNMSAYRCGRRRATPMSVRSAFSSRAPGLASASARSRSTSSAVAFHASTASAGRTIARAATVRRPRTRYTVGREGALLALTRILPDRLLDRLLAASLRPYLPLEVA